MRAFRIILCALLIAAGGVCVWSVFSYQLQDHTAPEIFCSSDAISVSVNADESALLSGVTARDAQDGVLDDQVMVMGVSKLISDSTARISYVVFDKAGNMASTSRLIHYTDYRKPQFALSAPLTYDLGSTITLSERLTASDDIDGDLTNVIAVTSQNFVTGYEGVYSIDVQVINSLGDTASLTLPVFITRQNIDAPVLTLKHYILYLNVGDVFDVHDEVLSLTDPTVPESTLSAEQVKVSSGVDTSAPGVFTVTYSYTGTTGIEKSIPLVVVVQ